MSYFVPSPSITQSPERESIAPVPRFRVVRSEDRPPYDGIPVAPASDPAPAREWRPMIPQATLSPEIGPDGIAAYVALSFYVDGKTGDCWPSLTVIGARLGISRQRVARAVARLQSSGLVVITPQDNRGMKRANLYHLPHQKTANVQMLQNETTLLQNRTADVTERNSSCYDLEHKPYVSEPNDNEPDDGLPPLTPQGDESDKPAPAVKPEKPTTAPIYPEDMLTFWNAYPGVGRDRSSRAKVLAVWKQLAPDATTADAIVHAVDAWSQKPDWSERYAPGADRWLKERKWEELPTVTTPSANGHRAGTPTVGDGNREAFRKAREILVGMRRPADPEPEPDDAYETTGVVR